MGYLLNFILLFFFLTENPVSNTNSLDPDQISHALQPLILNYTVFQGQGPFNEKLGLNGLRN